MKRFIKASGALFLAVFLAISAPAAAASAQTVSIDGYSGEVGTSQFTISNVLQKEADDYFEGVPTYTCEAPAVITTTVDLSELYVASVKAVEDGWEEGVPLSVDGFCVVYDDSFAKQTMSCKEAENNQQYMISSYKSGCTVTVDKPGTYHITVRHVNFDSFAEAVIIIKGDDAPVAVKAAPTTAKVLVNGTATSFDAYAINGNNYFKLRDLAKVVSGTKKQFEVMWDAGKNAINLKSGNTYTPVGGELTKGNGAQKTATPCTSSIYKDGVAVTLTAYTINGNNYFKLRDVAQAFDIGVTWNAKTATIGIDTAISYTPN